MGLIVQKFGGTSVANADRIRNVAQIIADTYRQGNQVVAVLSAQGDTTDDLIEKAKEINPNASKREMDMLLSTGEQISCALCAMAIETMGLPVVSLTGWQAGFQTNSSYSSARIKKINAERVQSELDRSHSIVIVTGFQGINKYGDITTLGRGGSDTSAVALAAALKADLCQIYTDVDGIYTADPRYVKGARKLEEITYRRDAGAGQLGRSGPPQPFRGAGQEISGEFRSAVQFREKTGHESQGGCKANGKDPDQRRGKRQERSPFGPGGRGGPPRYRL